MVPHAPLWCLMHHYGARPLMVRVVFLQHPTWCMWFFCNTQNGACGFFTTKKCTTVVHVHQYSALYIRNMPHPGASCTNLVHCGKYATLPMHYNGARFTTMVHTHQNSALYIRNSAPMWCTTAPHWVSLENNMHHIGALTHHNGAKKRSAQPRRPSPSVRQLYCTTKFGTVRVPD